jgi:hypothetical protein
MNFYQDKLMKKFQQIEQRRKIQFIVKDTVLVSYPKSGRTWLRMMMAKVLKEMGHDVSSFEMLPAMHLSPLDANDRFGKNLRVVFLYRNIGDVIMSFFWESLVSDRNGVAVHTPPSRFIRDNKYGLPNIERFYNLWFKNVENFQDHMFMTYEALQTDTVSELHRLLKFVNKTRDMKIWTYDEKSTFPAYPNSNPFTNLTQEKIKNAVEFAKFDNMKKIELAGVDGNDNLLKNYKGNFGSVGVKDKEAKQVLLNKAHPSLLKWMKDHNLSFNNDNGRLRKGKVNDYLNYLNEDDVNYIKHIESKINFPNLDLPLGSFATDQDLL